MHVHTHMDTHMHGAKMPVTQTAMFCTRSMWGALPSSSFASACCAVCVRPCRAAPRRQPGSGSAQCGAVWRGAVQRVNGLQRGAKRRGASARVMGAIVCE